MQYPRPSTPISLRDSGAVSRAATCAILLLLAACHADAFTTPDQGGNTPLQPGDPVLLTYNTATDRGPRWLPDGSGIAYSLEDRADPAHDRCIGILPGTGGQLLSQRCERADGSDTTTDAWEWPSPASDGRILFVRTVAHPGGLVFRSRHLALQATAGAVPENLVSFPYTPMAGRQVFDARDIRWLSPTSAVYLAMFTAYAAPCQGCAPDTVVSGLEVARVDFSGTPSVSTIPGTDLASSVALDPSGTAIYYTLNGDTRVYRQDLATGAVTTVHDFLAAGVARDVDVAGSRLVAVVGGSVSFSVDPVLGPVQRDEGGLLYLVNLGNNAETPLAQVNRCWRHPSLSPQGDQLVAEGYIYVPADTVFDGCMPGDAVAKSADLWLLDLP